MFQDVLCRYCGTQMELWFEGEEPEFQPDPWAVEVGYELDARGDLVAALSPDGNGYACAACRSKVAVPARCIHCDRIFEIPVDPDEAYLGHADPLGSVCPECDRALCEARDRVDRLAATSWHE